AAGRPGRNEFPVPLSARFLQWYSSGRRVYRSSVAQGQLYAGGNMGESARQIMVPPYRRSRRRGQGLLMAPPPRADQQSVARSNSLVLVFPRVFASTRLTITAQ